MADHLFLRPPATNIYPVYYPLKKEPFPKRCVTTASHGQILWVEFKRAGKKPSPHQYDWHQIERLRGFLTIMAGVDFEPSFDGFREWYIRSGLARREL